MSLSLLNVQTIVGVDEDRYEEKETIIIVLAQGDEVLSPLGRTIPIPTMEQTRFLVKRTLFKLGVINNSEQGYGKITTSKL